MNEIPNQQHHQYGMPPFDRKDLGGTTDNTIDASSLINNTTVTSNDIDNNDNDTDSIVVPIFDIDGVQYVTQLRRCDVLLGRGSGPNDHQGNIKFRQYISERKVEYNSTNHRATKTCIARDVVQKVYTISKGRFLKKVDTTVLSSSILSTNTSSTTQQQELSSSTLTSTASSNDPNSTLLYKLTVKATEYAAQIQASKSNDNNNNNNNSNANPIPSLSSLMNNNTTTAGTSKGNCIVFYEIIQEEAAMEKAKQALRHQLNDPSSSSATSSGNNSAGQSLSLSSSSNPCSVIGNNSIPVDQSRPSPSNTMSTPGISGTNGIGSESGISISAIPSISLQQVQSSSIQIPSLLSMNQHNHNNNNHNNHNNNPIVIGSEYQDISRNRLQDNTALQVGVPAGFTAAAAATGGLSSGLGEDDEYMNKLLRQQLFHHQNQMSGLDSTDSTPNTGTYYDMNTGTSTTGSTNNNSNNLYNNQLHNNNNNYPLQQQQAHQPQYNPLDYDDGTNNATMMTPDNFSMYLRDLHHGSFNHLNTVLELDDDCAAESTSATSSSNNIIINNNNNSNSINNSYNTNNMFGNILPEPIRNRQHILSSGTPFEFDMNNNNTTVERQSQETNFQFLQDQEFQKQQQQQQLLMMWQQQQLQQQQQQQQQHHHHQHLQSQLQDTDQLQQEEGEKALYQLIDRLNESSRSALSVESTESERSLRQKMFLRQDATMQQSTMMTQDENNNQKHKLYSRPPVSSVLLSSSSGPPPTITIAAAAASGGGGTGFGGLGYNTMRGSSQLRDKSRSSFTSMGSSMSRRRSSIESRNGRISMGTIDSLADSFTGMSTDDVTNTHASNSRFIGSSGGPSLYQQHNNQRYETMSTIDSEAFNSMILHEDSFATLDGDMFSFRVGQSISEVPESTTGTTTGITNTTISDNTSNNNVITSGKTSSLAGSNNNSSGSRSSVTTERDPTIK